MKQSFLDHVKQYDGCIYFFARRLGLYDYCGTYFQEGLFGLWEAYRTFDAANGEFSAHAGAKIKSRLLDYWRQNHNRYWIGQQINSTLKWELHENLRQVHREDDPYLLNGIRSKLTINQWKWLYVNVILPSR
ncbi:sigma factor [Lentibacillus salicampi]|uniref:sigma factor n=1 Tax=Lentibacillus salicampi TaxID=175306 RepID=UPI0014304386|nr:sigma factor [Lentibacillus salicampi]